MMKNKMIHLLLALALLSAPAISAAETKTEKKHETKSEAKAEHAETEHASHAESAHHEEHHGEHAHNNHVAIFLGATTTSPTTGAHGTVPGETFFTFGADYERRFSALNGLLGCGVLVDVGLASAGAQIIAGPALFIHPFAGLKLVAMPGVEYSLAHRASAFAFRASLGYDIPVGSYSLTPTVSADFISGNISYVYGLAIGRGF